LGFEEKGGTKRSFGAGITKTLPSRAAKAVFKEEHKAKVKKRQKKRKEDNPSKDDDLFLRHVVTHWKFSDVPDPDNMVYDIANPYTLATDVSPDDFENFLRLLDSFYNKLIRLPRLKVEYEDGTVLAWTFTLPGHGAATAAFSAIFYQYNVNNGRRWYASSNQSVKVAQGAGGANPRWLMPDAQLNISRRIVPAGVLPDQPVVVVEIGSSETAPHLYRKVKKYFTAQTNVRVVICIKIYGQHANGTRPLLALVFNRPAPLLAAAVDPPSAQAISFGSCPIVAASVAAINTWGAAVTGVIVGAAAGTGCTAAGIAAYTITVPAAILVTNAPGPAAGAAAFPAPGALNIDLFDVQQVIFNAVG